MGVKDSGHSLPQPSAAGPKPRHLCVARGGEASTAELVARIGAGSTMRQFHYVNLVEPLDLTLTGMTRGGTLQDRGGELGGPVQNLRFTESLVGALQRVVGVGADLESPAAP